MAKQGAKTVTPRLRFPEYRKAQPWLVKRFEQLLTIGSGRDYKHLGPGDIPVYGSGGYMLSVDDYIYEGESACIGRKGTIDRPIFLSGKFWTVDTLFYTHSFIDCLPRFVFLHFLSIHWQNHNEAGGVPSLSKSNIEKIEVAVPSIAEQQKIADCLMSLDEVIAAQGRKVEALNTHKRGLMQQLFPREGETRPRLRFPEFRNAPEWEAKSVADVFRVTRGEVLAMPLVKDERSSEAPYPVYSSQTKNHGLAGYYSKFLYEDAITWTTDGANAGEVNYRTGKFYCTNVCGVLLSNEGYANPCIAALLNTVTRSHVSYVGNPKLMNGVMGKITIAFPSLEEQRRIADFLSSLDNQITAESNQLAALKTHKQGLMQQLFPAPEAASA